MKVLILILIVALSIGCSSQNRYQKSERAIIAKNSDTMKIQTESLILNVRIYYHSLAKSSGTETKKYMFQNGRLTYEHDVRGSMGRNNSHKEDSKKLSEKELVQLLDYIGEHFLVEKKEELGRGDVSKLIEISVNGVLDGAAFNYRIRGAVEAVEKLESYKSAIALSELLAAMLSKH